MMTLQAEPLSDGLVQVRVAMSGRTGDAVLPEAFSLYSGATCVGYAGVWEDGWLGYAEAEYAQALAVVPIYDGQESDLEAVILSAPAESSPARWSAQARACCGYTVNASALMVDDGLLSVQVIHTACPDGGDPISGWYLYLNGQYELTLQPYRLPGDPEEAVRYYGTASPVGVLRSVTLVPVLTQAGPRLKQAVTLDAE